MEKDWLLIVPLEDRTISALEQTKTVSGIVFYEVKTHCLIITRHIRYSYRSILA
jgi:hypothetical protein